MPGCIPGCCSSVATVVALLEWVLACIRLGQAAFSQAVPRQFAETRDQEPLSVSIQPFCFGDSELNGMDKSPLCQLALENSTRLV